MFSPPCNYFTIHKMIINYPKAYSFVDNQEGKAYNWNTDVLLSQEPGVGEKFK